MPKQPIILALTLAAFTLTACDQTKTGAGKPATSATQSAPALVGTYQGVLPCASCAGIETTLVLNADGSYRLTTLFLEVPDAKPESVSGHYKQSDDKTLIRLDENGDNYTYAIGENQLEMRDSDGSNGGRSEEENANYRLKKQTDDS